MLFALGLLIESIGIITVVSLLTGIALDSSSAPGGTTLSENKSFSFLSKHLEFLSLQDSFSDRLAVLLAICCLFFALKGIFVFLSNLYAANLKARLSLSLRTEWLNRFSLSTSEYVSQLGRGGATTILSEQITRTIQAFDFFVQTNSQLIATLIYISVALAFSLEFGVLAIIFCTVVYFVFKSTNRKLAQLSADVAVCLTTIISVFMKGLESFSYLVTTGQSKIFFRKLTPKVTDLVNRERRSALLVAFTVSLREPMAVILVSAIIFVSYRFFESTFSLLLVGLMMFYRAFNSAYATQKLWQKFIGHLGSVNLVRASLRHLSKAKEADGVIEIAEPFKKIQLENVSYKYLGANRDVISDVSLHISRGEKVVIVGKPGSGKTTVLRLISLLMQPSEGRILIDGVLSSDIKKLSWRSRLSFVPQDGIIYNASLRENILNLEQNNSRFDVDTRIDNVVTALHLQDLLAKLPNGMDSPIGEGVGANALSGGERQLVILARELIRYPQILLTDEATSAMDAYTSGVVSNALFEFLNQATWISVTHSHTDLRRFDKVIVMDEGRILAMGSYDEVVNMVPGLN